MYKCVFKWEIWSAPAILVYQKHNMHFKKTAGIHFTFLPGKQNTRSHTNIFLMCLFENKVKIWAKMDEVLTVLSHYGMVSN